MVAFVRKLTMQRRRKSRRQFASRSAWTGSRGRQRSGRYGVADSLTANNYPRRVSNSRAADRVGQVLGGRYRLLAPIGTGASATVYLADDVVLRRRVAVKVLHDALAGDASFLKRFRAEAQAAAALNHPNVMAVHDWGQGDVPYLVTEMLAGGSLRGLLDTGARLDLAQTRHIGIEAANALDYAQRRGFVHRDIKPANLLFDDEARLRIADFGLARALAEAAWTEPAGAILGTARYASPEQAQGAVLDGRSDVYSLGLVLIEAVTGQVPFATDTTLGTLMGRVDKNVPVPASLGELVPALQAVGVPNPADRPDAAEFATMLMAAGDLGPVAALPLAGTATLRPDELDPREPTTMYVPESAVLARATSDAVDATGVVFISDDINQPATRVIERPAFDLDLAIDDFGPGRRGAGGGSVRKRRLSRRSFLVTLLALLIVGGGAAFMLLRTPTHVLGDYVSTTIEEARNDLSSKGLKIAETGTYDESIPSGIVITQDPLSGVSLAEGKTVSLTVSLGPPPVPVPTDLVGKSVDQATVALSAAGLKTGTLIDAFDENVAKGIVLSLAEGVGAEAPKGSAVNLIVSAGPKPRTVPADLIGKPVDSVTAQLTALGLKVARDDAYSETVAEGIVISVNPASGATVAKGGSVTVSASKGRRPVTIPQSIIGKTVAAAEAELTALGLVVNGVSGPPSGRVTGSTPAVGSQVKPGSSLQLTTR
ncbi:PASTA_pknB domain containing protein [Acidimicrobiia bacterium]